MLLLSSLVHFIVVLSMAVSVISSTGSFFGPYRPSQNDPCGPCQTSKVATHITSCGSNMGVRGVSIRDDYYYTPRIGYHKLHTRALPWNQARKVCYEEGGHLAIINSIAEARVLMDLFNRSGPVKGTNVSDGAFLGTHDLYTEGDWITVLGDPLSKTGYSEWSDKWGGQLDNTGGNQHCGAFLKEGKMDDFVCDIPHAFFCELSCTLLY